MIHERALMLHYTSIACLVVIITIIVLFMCTTEKQIALPLLNLPIFLCLQNKIDIVPPLVSPVL